MNATLLDQTILTHAVREQHKVSNAFDLVVESLHRDGFAVAPSSLTQANIDFAKDRLDQVYVQQCNDIGGEENLKKIKDANIARAVCAYDKCFLDMAMLPIIQQVSKAVLGPYVTLMSQNGILNRPGTDHQQFTWHRDLNYQHWTSSRMISLSALVCLDPFNEVTGGTYILPGSHRSEIFPSDEYVRANQRVVTADPGAVIFFDSMLFHRTGANRSDMMRRGINHIIVPPFIKQQYNFPAMMAGQGVTDSATQQFLGFGMEIASDDLSWRKGKLKLAQA